MRRVWTSLGVGLGLLVLGVPGWIAYHSRDLASVDESGLLDEDRPPLLPADNAAVPLADAARLLNWPSGEGAMERVRDIRNRASSDSDSARALVRRNEGALEWLRQAMLIREIEISAEELLPTGNSPGASPFVLWLRLLEIHHVQGALRMADGDGEGHTRMRFSGCAWQIACTAREVPRCRTPCWQSASGTRPSCSCGSSCSAGLLIVSTPGV